MKPTTKHDVILNEVKDLRFASVGSNLRAANRGCPTQARFWLEWERNPTASYQGMASAMPKQFRK